MDNTELVRAYLSGKMSASEIAQFEERLSADGALQSLLKKKRELTETLDDLSMDKLKEQMKDIANEEE